MCLSEGVAKLEGERDREAGWIGRGKLHYFFYSSSNSLSLRSMSIEMPLWNPSLKKIQKLFQLHLYDVEVKIHFILKVF
jgi:hypothetical protein